MMRESEKSTFTYQTLLFQVLGGVRRKAETIPVFHDSHNGCVRITLIPLSREADEWLGGLNSYIYSSDETLVDLCEREFIFKIHPCGNHTIQCQDPQIANHVEPVNCYAYSALKMAYAKWKHWLRLRLRYAEISQEEYDQQFRDQTKFFIEENGWSRHKGAVAMTVGFGGEEFLQIFVCTSGADSRDDHECSLAGMLEAQRFFMEHGTEVSLVPLIDETKSPLEQIW